MGRVNLPCNMDAAEADSYLKEFQIYLSGEEEEHISEKFSQYLFYETWGRKDFREFTCTHTDCGSFELYKGEEPEIFQHKHGDSVYCPRCGNEVTLIALGKMRSFTSLKQTRRITLCRIGKNGNLLLTSGWARKEYSWNNLRPLIWFNEKTRYCFTNGKRMQWSEYCDWNGIRYVGAGWYPEE